MGTIQRNGYLWLMLVMMGFSPVTFSEEIQSEMSWFGHTGATPNPVHNEGSGYWWWPTQPASNEDDQELWGNRGIVYGQYTVTAPIVRCPAPLPPPPPRIDHFIGGLPFFNSVLFDFDSAILRVTGQKELDRVVATLDKNIGVTVTVLGHTCDLGPEDYNLQLSQQRADAVAHYLISQGIESNRVEAIGKGETHPAVRNDSAENRSKNRRVVFWFKI